MRERETDRQTLRDRERDVEVWWKTHLRLLNHFFFLSRPRNLLWTHLGNNWLPWLVCLLWMWLSNDSHLTFIVSPLPSVVDATHQYKWLMMLFCHLATNSHCFCLARASIFLRSPAGRCTTINNKIIIAIKTYFHTLCYVPDIKVVFNLRMGFSDPLSNLFVPVCH